MSSEHPARRLLRPNEAAGYLASSESTLAKYRISGKGPIYVKLGKSVLYDVRDLDAHVASHRRRSTSDPGEAV